MITRALCTALVLAAAQDELIPGRDLTLAVTGEPARVRCAIERPGTLFVFALGEGIAPRLRVESAEGEPLGSDEDAASESALVELVLEVPRELVVICEAPGDGRLLLGARLSTPEEAARATALEGRGHEARNAFDYLAAAEAFEAAHAIRESTWPPDHPGLQDLRLYLAMVSSHLGRHARALELQELVLASRERTLPPLASGLQEARNDLAVTLFQMGDVRGAYACMREVYADARRSRPPDHPEVQHACANLAEMARHMGDLEGAFELESRLLEVRERLYGADHPETLDARLRRAVTLDHMGRFEESRDLAADCLERLTARFPPDSPLVLRARTTLARALTHVEDFVSAEELYRNNLERLAPRLAPTSGTIVSLELNLAVMRKAQGDYASARELEERSLAVLEQTSVEDDPTRLRARRNLAWSLAGLGDVDGARETAGELAATLRRSLGRTAVTMSPREAEAVAHGLRKEITTVVQLAGPDRFERSEPLDRVAFALVESVRSIGLLASRSLARASDSEDVHRLRDAIRAQNAALVRAGTSGGEGELDEAVRARDAAVRQLQQQLDRTAGPRELDLAFTAADIAAALDGRAAVSYWKSIRSVMSGEREVRTDVLLAWVLRSDGSFERLELGPLAAVRRAVDDWRDALLAETPRGRAPGEVDPDRAERAAGEALRALVLDPVLALAGEADELVVALDDVLHRVPLDALPLGDGRVGDARVVSLQPSLRELISTAPERDAEPTLVTFGGIEYGISTSDDWDPGFVPLPGTLGEVDAIEALFEQAFERESGRVWFVGEDATKAALAEAAPTARWLHLATHGYFAGVRDSAVGGLAPLSLCGLGLAGANRPPDARGRLPGVITGEEVSTLDLRGCELAVLSACDTNVGLRRDGQGVASLQKALHMAGARSVVTSLWPVPDAATRELMTDFYRRLWLRGEPKAVALWAAKNRLRAKTDAEGRPVHRTGDWAAWVLTGESE